MPSEALSHWRWTRYPCAPSRLLLVVLTVVVSGPVACASNSQPQALAPTRDALAELDEFGALLVMAGLPSETIPTGREMSLEQARRLRLLLRLLPYNPRQFPPRFVVEELLLAIEKHGEAVSRWDLSRKVQDYQSLYLLRPDGYLAAALTGMPDRCVGPVEARDNGLFAGAFELDVYYKLDGYGRPERVDSPSAGAR